MSKKKKTGKTISSSSGSKYLHTAAKNEFKREMTSKLMYPVMLGVVILLFLSFNLISGETEGVFWTWILVTMIAGIFSLIISYLVATRKHRRK